MSVIEASKARLLRFPPRESGCSLGATPLRYPLVPSFYLLLVSDLLLLVHVREIKLAVPMHDDLYGRQEVDASH